MFLFFVSIFLLFVFYSCSILCFFKFSFSSFFITFKPLKLLHQKQNLKRSQKPWKRGRPCYSYEVKKYVLDEKLKLTTQSRETLSPSLSCPTFPSSCVWFYFYLVYIWGENYGGGSITANKGPLRVPPKRGMLKKKARE